MERAREQPEGYRSISESLVPIGYCKELRSTEPGKTGRLGIRGTAQSCVAWRVANESRMVSQSF